MIRLFENMNGYGLKCQEIADLLNAASGNTFDESRWRKRFKTFHQGRIYGRNESGTDFLIAQTREMEKQKIALAEQRAAINRAIRQDAKRDIAFEEIRNQFLTLDPIPFHPTKSNTHKTDETLLVCLSDLHIGIEFDNQYGHYSTEVAQSRLEAYASRVVDEAQRRGTQRCIVALLGDLVSGVCHTQIRIENRENYVEQIKTAGELISQFVASIAPVFQSVDLYGVAGNHSRAVQNEKDALVAECFDNLIPWYVSARLRNDQRIVVHADIDVAGVTKLTLGKKVIGLVHGHMDSTDEKNIARLNALCGVLFDYVFCGHMHTCGFGSILSAKIIRCGCLCGSGDEYTLKNRLSGEASQIMVAFDVAGAINAVVPVVFS